MIWLKRIFLISAGAVVITGATFAVTRQTNIFRVRQIPIVINNNTQDAFRADNATIVDLKARLQAKLKIFEKQKIWDIKIRDMSTLVHEDEWVKNVRITRVFPNKLEVVVTPRAAVFLVATKDGKLLPVAADGEVVTAVNPSALPDVPILKGEQFLKSSEFRAKAIEFARQLPQDGSLSLNNFSEISWTRDEGFAANLLSSRSTIIFGDGPITLKVARIGQILDYLTAHQLKERTIDASSSKKVLVRLRKAQ